MSCALPRSADPDSQSSQIVAAAPCRASENALLQPVLPSPSFPSYQLHEGDCLDVMGRLPSASFDAILTDPPYSSGSRQSAGARNTISKSRSCTDEEWFDGDAMGADSYAWWMRLVAFQALRLTVWGGQAYVFTDWRQYPTLVAAWESTGWTLKQLVVWDKARGGGMGTMWRNNHEFVCVFVKGKVRWPKGFGIYNTFSMAKRRGGKHPTEKPVPLLSYVLQAVPRGTEGERPRILDCFNGSGSSGIAALLADCDYVGIERKADYVEYSRERLEATLAELRAAPEGTRISAPSGARL